MSPPLLGQTGQPPPAGSEEVVFHRDVQPILRRRCFACHSTGEAKGGLRLDAKKYAVRGGDSGGSILAGSLSENEIFRRITSTEDGHRMPLEGGPLADNEIRTIRRWVEQGANWPDEPPPEPVNVLIEPWYVAYTEPLQQHVDRLGWAPAILVVFLVLVLVNERLKARWRKQGDEQPAGPFRRCCQRLSVPLCLAIGLAIVCGGLIQYIRHLQHDLRRSEQRFARSNSDSPDDGNPRWHIHEAYFPPHPPRLSGEYYRGNDERSDELFNGGFYRTATLRLALCDADKLPLEVGDEVEGPMWVRVEIQRAKSATPTLFTNEIMQATFMSQVLPGVPVEDVSEQVMHFETARDGELWQAYFPVAAPKPGEQSAAGTFYIYKGNIRDNVIQGSAHYQVDYDLAFEGKRLLEGSALRMGNVLRFGALHVPQQGEIQMSEWFDSRPIPEIDGENSTDPILLGAPEHVSNRETNTPPTARENTSEKPPASNANSRE